MIIKWAIASEAQHASVSLWCWVTQREKDPATITMETLNLFDTEEEGRKGLEEFRATYDERNYVPRSGLIHGSGDEFHLWRVEYHEHAERVS